VAIRRGTRLAIGDVAAGRFQHEQGQQGAVDDEAGVAHFGPAAGGVVVNAVRVGRQGTESEERRRVRVERELPRLVGTRGGGPAGGDGVPGVVAVRPIDDVLFLDDAGAAVLAGTPGVR
jgi:hypothetical protein